MWTVYSRDFGFRAVKVSHKASHPAAQRKSVLQIVITLGKFGGARSRPIQIVSTYSSSTHRTNVIKANDVPYG